MICASSWLQSWNDDTSKSLLESTRVGAEEKICSSMSVLASCVSNNEKSSFYSTHLQVRFTVVSENRSAAISMWLKSNTYIQPTPLLCPRFQVLFG